MFFWKFTRSGKYSSKYISLVFDFHSSCIHNNHLLVSYEECKDMMILIHDVETLNGISNNSAGLLKQPFQEQVNSLGYRATDSYVMLRASKNLVIGKMTLGTHMGSPLDFGKAIHSDNKEIALDIRRLQIRIEIDARTGVKFGIEDKLKAYRHLSGFINTGYYFDLMPKHSCMIEIVNKMQAFDVNATNHFLRDSLKWEPLTKE